MLQAEVITLEVSEVENEIKRLTNTENPAIVEKQKGEVNG